MSKIRDLMPWNLPSAVDVRRGEFGFSLAAAQEEMNRLFERLYRGAEVHLTDWDMKLPATPSINVIETGDSFKVEAALPGMDPKNVSVETAGGYLTISGETCEEKQEKKGGKEGGYLRQEIACGSFLRTVALPETADFDKAKATFRNGILTVAVPKKAEAVQKPRKIEIKEAA
jgi:HSP20 family protein